MRLVSKSNLCFCGSAASVDKTTKLEHEFFTAVDSPANEEIVVESFLNLRKPKKQVVRQKRQFGGHHGGHHGGQGFGGQGFGA